MRTATEPGFDDSTASSMPPPQGPARAAAQPPARRRRVLWPWVLLALVLLVMVLTAASLAWLFSVFMQAPGSGPWAGQGEQLMERLSLELSGLVNQLAQAWPWLGELDWKWSFEGVSVGGLTLALLLLFLGLVLALLGTVTVVPFIVLACLACALLATLGALLLAAALSALLLSPLWLPVLAVWWWLRRRRRPGVAPSPVT